jgi:hypothetical protein
MGDRRKLYNEEPHALHPSPDIIRVITSMRMRWARHVACMGKKRKAYRVLMHKPEGRRRLGRLSHRWKDNTQMDLRHTEWESVDWVHLGKEWEKWRAVTNR